MPNTLYDKGREGFLGGDIAFDTDAIKYILVDTADYVFAQTHQFLSDVPAIARTAVGPALTAKTIVNGVADAADFAFALVSGDPSEALIIFQDTGVETSSRLIAYIDTATGLPVTPNGQDINVTLDAQGIFKL